MLERPWKHPTLTEIRLSGFRSFRSGAEPFRPGKLAVLFGANASGKSNLLRGIEFLADVAGGCRPPSGDPLGGTLDEHIREAGGMGTFLNHDAAGRSMEIDARFHQIEGPERRYTIALSEPTPGAAFIVLERLLEGRKVVLERRGGDIELDDEKSGLGKAHKLGSLYPTIVGLGTQFQADTRETLRRLARFEIQPIKIRSELNARLRKESVLAQDGTNLAARLDTLHARRDGVFERIEELTREMWPGLERLLLNRTGDGRVFIEARERGLGDGTPHWCFSDGILQFLALLAALLDPDPPPLMAFEEPECHLHPKMMETIADVMVEASTRAQILLATHHMTLITRLGEEAGLDALHHVRNEGRGTVIAPVGSSKALRKAIEESGLGIGRVWASGGFPGGR